MNRRQQAAIDLELENTRGLIELFEAGRTEVMAVSGIAHTGKRVPHQDRTREVIGVWSALVPREQVPASVVYFES